MDMEIPSSSLSKRSSKVYVFCLGVLGFSECRVYLLDLSHGGGVGGDSSGVGSSGGDSGGVGGSGGDSGGVGGSGGDSGGVGGRTDEFGFTSRYPILRFDSMDFFRWSFCIIGATFYAFEGSEGYNRIVRSEARGIYEFRLPASDEANIKLEKNMLSQTCLMKNSKIQPITISSPDGKRVVILSSVMKKSDKLELFDPVLRQCSKLPQIPSNWLPNTDCSSQTFRVRSCNFMSSCVFLLEMEFGFFTIDIEDRVPRWKRLKNFYRGMVPRVPYIVKDDNLCLTPLCAYNIIGLDCVSDLKGESAENKVFLNSYDSIFRWRYYFPRASEIPGDLESAINSITLLEGEGDTDFRFCILRTGRNADSERVYMILDVYRCNLFQCREDLIRNFEREKADYRSNTDQINQWRNELPAPGEYDPTKDIQKLWDYDRKTNDLLGRRKSCPLPGSSLEKSLKYFIAEKSEDFLLVTFSHIPTGASEG